MFGELFSAMFGIVDLVPPVYVPAGPLLLGGVLAAQLWFERRQG